MFTRLDTTLMPLVRKLRYWSEIDTADEAALLALPYRAKTIGRNDYVVREGDRATQSCLLLSGFAIRHKVVMGGSRQIVAIHMKGDMLDLQNSFLQIADHSVQVLTESELAFIPVEAIKKIAFEHPNIGRAMWFDTLVDGSIFREWISNVGRRDAETRISHLLCEFSLRLKVARLGAENEYELPMTQEQLGDCTGLTSVHVNRVLKILQEKKLITRKSSRTITIGNWKRLAEAADFDSNYLHLRENEPALA